MLRLLLAVLVVGVSPAWAVDTLTGREIIDSLAKQPTPKSSAVVVRMTLIAKRGSSQSEQVRSVKMFAKRTDDGLRTLLKFTEPKDVQGVSLLVVERKDAADDQWLYLPALKQEPKRVSGGQRNQSFLGTDFSFADLEGQNPDHWEFVRLPDETRDGRAFWVIESRPKPEAQSEYVRTVQWIRQDIKLPERIEMYNAAGLLKVFTVSEFKNIDGFNIAVKTRMENVVKNHATVMEIVDQKNNIDVPDDVFTTRSMKQ